MSIYNAREQRLLKIPDIVIQCIRTGLHASLLCMCSVPKSCSLRASSVSVPRQRLGASMLATGFLGNCGRRSPLTTCLHGHPESSRRCSCQTIDSVRKTYPALFVATEDSRFFEQHRDTSLSHGGMLQEALLCLPFAWTEVFDSDLSCRSERSQCSAHCRSAPSDHRQIDESRLPLHPLLAVRYVFHRG
jgi:hypothetical protein